MYVWRFNGKCYLKTNQEKTANETQKGDIDIIEFRKGHPYILDGACYIYGFEKNEEMMGCCTIPEMNEYY